MSAFCLVQRMKRALNGPITTPEHLRLDYMGSAEFELGAISKAYKAMQAQKLIQTTVAVKAFNTKTTLYVVAPADQADSLQKRFQAWFDGGLRSQENPYLDRVITRKGWVGETLSDEECERLPIAWWALREKFFFATDESVANMWLNAMSGSKAAPPETGPMVCL